ncbi:MAG: ATP-binding protein, partial [Verrucomicrobiota bacterium]
DVTEEKKLQSQFLRAQRMECIGTLASGVAHDLNNVLSPIMMGASMLHEDLPPELHEQLVTTIDEAARRGADIVRQVLTFARGVEGERLVLQPWYIIREIEKIARETFPKSIAIINQTPEDLWNLEGDTTQLHQVLLNLCLNSRDAMPEGGTLTFSAENILVDVSYASMVPGAEPGRYVVFQVQDTGTGISRENQVKIFDPFFTTKKPGMGTGLGLSMVIGIAKSHGGFVTLESEPGCGTLFKVFIPAVASEISPGQVPELETPELPCGNGELILLVDDEEGILLMAETILKKQGYNVVTARDGVEAVSLYAMHKHAVKLVITDIMMPFVDGVALARALKNMDPDITIIASTGQAEKSRQNELRAQGVMVFLHKPYSTKQLLIAVQQNLPVAN